MSKIKFLITMIINLIKIIKNQNSNSIFNFNSNKTK